MIWSSTISCLITKIFENFLNFGVKQFLLEIPTLTIELDLNIRIMLTISLRKVSKINAFFFNCCLR